MIYRVYFNDGVNQPSEAAQLGSLADVKQWLRAAVVGKCIMKSCSDELFSSSRVARYEAYEGEPVYIEHGEPQLRDIIASTDYFYNS